MKKIYILVITILSFSETFAQNGTCANPNKAYDDKVSFDSWFDLVNSSWLSSSSSPTYWKVKSSSNGTLGIVTNLPEVCKKTATYELFAPGDCGGTAILATVILGKNDKYFNPEWIGLSPNTDYTLKISACNSASYVNVNRYDACVDPKFSMYKDDAFETIRTETTFLCTDGIVYLAPENYNNLYKGGGYPEIKPGAGWPFPGFKIFVNPDMGNFDNTLLKIYDDAGNFVESTTLTTGEPYYYFYFPNATGNTFSFDITNNSSNSFDYIIIDMISGDTTKTGKWTVTNGKESAKSDICIPTGRGKFECSTCGPDGLIQGIATNYLNNQGIATFDPKKAGAGKHIITYKWDNNYSIPHCTYDFSLEVNVIGSPDKPVLGTTTKSLCGSPTGTAQLSGLPTGNWIITATDDIGSTLTANGSGASYTFTKLNAFKKYTFVVRQALPNACTSNASDTAFIDGDAPITPSISGSDTICFGQAATLTAISINAGNFKWYNVPENGVPLDSGISFTSDPLSADTIFYAESIDGNCKSINRDTFNIHIRPLDDSSFNYPAANYCIGSTTNPLPIITGLPNGIFKASPVGIIIDSVSGEIKLDSTSKGNYSITYSTKGGFCPNDSSANITISEKPDASFKYDTTSFCKTAELASPIIQGSYSSNFSSSPSGLVIDSITGVIDLLKSMPGKYVITNTISGALCSGILTYNSDSITINALPETPVLTGNAAVNYCLINQPRVDTLNTLFGLTSKLNWYKSVNDSLALMDTVRLITSTYYTALFDSTIGCESNKLEVSVTLENPDSVSIAANSITSVCEGNLATILASNMQNGITYKIYDAQGNFIDTLPFNFVPASNQDLFIEAINTNGCGQTTDKVKVNIIVKPNPANPQVLSKKMSGCAKESVSLSAKTTPAQNNLVYNWSGPKNFKSNLQNPLITNSADSTFSGKYYVTVTDTVNKCTSVNRDSVTVEINSLNASFTTNVTNGFTPLTVSFTNTSTNAMSYSWYFLDGEISNETDPSHIFKKEGNYKVYLIANNGACADTAYDGEIDVKIASFIEIPDIFTPNNDDKNDVFNVKAAGLNSLDCKIFNRWGILIYEWDQLNGGWDGLSMSGTEVPDGIYFYVINATGNDTVPYKFNGYLNLVR